MQEIARLRVQRASSGPQAAFSAEGSEAQRIVGLIESINVNFNFLRLRLTTDQIVDTTSCT